MFNCLQKQKTETKQNKKQKTKKQNKIFYFFSKWKRYHFTVKNLVFYESVDEGLISFSHACISDFIFYPI